MEALDGNLFGLNNNLLNEILPPSQFSKATDPVDDPADSDSEVSSASEELKTKKAIQFLLDGSLKNKVCRFCLNVTSSLSELDQILQVASQGLIYKLTIREMVSSIHPKKIHEDPNFPSKICNVCVDNTLSSYLFAQQCERAERALRNCFDDMYDKLEKLDPLERLKKRGRQKQNLNHNILFTEHEKVIDYAEPLITLINIGSELTTEESVKTSLICPKCWKDMPNIESLLNHEKSHAKSMWYHCHLCGKSFTKHNLLKKHLQAGHDTVNQEIEATDFKCGDCGTLSTNYHTHLRHIEKHKFKNVLEHLTNKKMHKLCAICFNTDSKLVDLDEMVCLHGGYPEMMGDRTLYNILGSTIPEKSTNYKYQELLLPVQAKTIKLTKFQKFNANKQYFSLSRPIIVSKDTISADNNVIFLYVFNKPIEIQQIGVEKAVVNKTVDKLDKKDLDEKSKVEKSAHHVDDNVKFNEFKYKEKDNLSIAINADITFSNFESTDDINIGVDFDKSQDDLRSTKDSTKSSKPDLINLNDLALDEELIKETLELENIEGANTSPVNVYMNKNKKLQDTKTVDKSINLFTFSNPDLIIDIDGDNIKMISKSDIKRDESTNVNEKANTVFKSNEIAVITTIKTNLEPYKCTGIDTEVKKLTEQTKCNKCWIFNKSSHICPHEKSGNLSNETKKSLQLNCPACWLFKDPKKCTFCTKNTQNISENLEQVVDDITNKQAEKAIESNVLKRAYNTTESSSENEKAIKIKKIESSDKKDDFVTKIQTTWKCNICLTINNDREYCVCCESQNKLNDTKFNFNEKSVNVFINTIKEENVDKNIVVPNKDTHESNEAEIMSYEEYNSIEHICIDKANIKNNDVEINIDKIEEKMEDSEVLNLIEEMDVVETTDLMKDNNVGFGNVKLEKAPVVFQQPFQQQFQFNIGSAFTGRQSHREKRMRRPFRRI